MRLPAVNKRLSVFIIVLLAAVVLQWSCSGGEQPSPQAGSGSLTAETASTMAPPSTTLSTPQATGTDISDFKFAVAGDNRIEGIKNGVLGRIVDSAKANGAAFIVDTGDITGDGSREELLQFKSFTDASGIKFYSVPGNHDIGPGGISAIYEEIIGPEYYSFDYGANHFIILDNADDKTGINEAQMQWYIADLDASAAKTHTFIFTHIPFANPSVPSAHVSGEKSFAGLESGQRAVDEALKHDNVKAFFFGHIHAYFAYKLGTADAYITGGAGAPLYFPETAGGYYHYLMVTVNGQQVTVEVVRV